MPNCRQPGCNKKANMVLYDTPDEANRGGGAWCNAHKPAGAVNVKHACNTAGCWTKATYGPPRNGAAPKKIKCKTHADPGWLSCNTNHCSHEGCTTTPSFAPPGEKATKCGKHKEANMVNVLHASDMCNHEDGCNVRATYKGDNDAKPVRCGKHKEPGMYDGNAKLCENEECHKRATFGAISGKPTHCLQHKPADALDVVNKRCGKEGCTTQPLYNHPDESFGILCHIHKEQGMIDVVSRVCNYAECNVRARFGPPGGKPERCGKHAEPGMDNKMRACEFQGCQITASLGFPNIGRVTHCAFHRMDGMIYLNNQYCNVNDCDNLACFNVPGEQRGIKCSDHREDGMVNVQTVFCDQPDCNKQAYVGIPGQPATRCGEHRGPGMLAHPNKKCTEDGCVYPAVCGTTSLAVRCEIHKLAEDRFLIYGKCNSCNNEIVFPEDGTSATTCENCGLHQKARERILAKQENLKKALAKDARLAGMLRSYDKIIDAACNLRRPDFVFEKGDRRQSVVVECDEEQHRGVECEELRMWQVTQALGNPTTFIRFNPDKFKTSAGKLGRASEAERTEVLVDWILRILGTPAPEGGLSVVYLYYDGWNGKKGGHAERVPEPVYVENRWQVLAHDAAGPSR